MDSNKEFKTIMEINYTEDISDNCLFFRRIWIS